MQRVTACGVLIYITLSPLKAQGISCHMRCNGCKRQIREDYWETVSCGHNRQLHS